MRISDILSPAAVRSQAQVSSKKRLFHDLAAMAPALDRVRVMTLDWSCCSRPGGPSTEAAWAAEAAGLPGDGDRRLAGGVPEKGSKRALLIMPIMCQP